MKFRCFFIYCLLLSVCTTAQELETETVSETNVKSIKPLRLGARLGVPNILTLNAEYVTPLLDHRVSAVVDFMAMSKTVDDVSIGYSNVEFGANVYLNNTGKGLYLGLSYFSFGAEGSFEDVEFDSGSYSGKGDLDFNTFNTKLGVKLGRTFFFRAEIGYGFGSIPDQVIVRSDQTSEIATEEFPEIPGISSSGILVFNLGIGFGIL